MWAGNSRNGTHPTPEEELEEALFLETDLDEEVIALLDSLLGKRVLSLALWTDPLAQVVADDLEEVERRLLQDIFVDVDLYFEDHLLLELYNTMVYLDETRPPVEDKARVARTLNRFVERGMQLIEIAEEEETGAPIFIFEQPDSGDHLLLVADGWLVDTWDYLPEEEE